MAHSSKNADLFLKICNYYKLKFQLFLIELEKLVLFCRISKACLSYLFILFLFWFFCGFVLGFFSIHVFPAREMWEIGRAGEPFDRRRER